MITASRNGLRINHLTAATSQRKSMTKSDPNRRMSRKIAPQISKSVIEFGSAEIGVKSTAKAIVATLVVCALFFGVGQWTLLPFIYDDRMRAIMSDSIPWVELNTASMRPGLFYYQRPYVGTYRAASVVAFGVAGVILLLLNAAYFDRSSGRAPWAKSIFSSSWDSGRCVPSP